MHIIINSVGRLAYSERLKVSRGGGRGSGRGGKTEIISPSAQYRVWHSHAYNFVRYKINIRKIKQVASDKNTVVSLRSSISKVYFCFQDHEEERAPIYKRI